MRKIFHQFFTIVLVTGSILLCADVAKACMCSVSPTVDIAFRTTPNVVVLKLKSFQSFRNKSYYIARMTVEKVFKGSLKVGQELVFRGIYSSCDGGFDKSEVRLGLLTYLDNKHEKEKYWSYPICSRSGGVEYKKDDLKYIENIDKVQGKTRLSGTISQDIESAIEGVEEDYKRLSNRTVRVVGNGKDIELKSDENGFWEIYDLPVGFYKISLEVIEGYGYQPNDGSKEVSYGVEIKSEQHTESNVLYRINNSISGKLFDTGGNPLNSVCLDLIPTHGKKGQYFHKFDCTEKDGSFKIDTIPIGKYVILVNEEDEITALSPFRKFYYPSAINIKDAKEITIDAGEHIKDIIITAPTTADTITVKGVLLYSDGSPVTKERVEFHTKLNSTKQLKGFAFSDSSEVTDENGRFSVRVLRGDNGILFSSVYPGEIEKCSNLKELAETKFKGLNYIYTNSITIDGKNNLDGIILKFPFPSCKKAKID